MLVVNKDTTEALIEERKPILFSEFVSWDLFTNVQFLSNLAVIY